MNAIASRLLAALAWPRSVDDYVELVDPLHSSREVRARIVEIVPETHDTATLYLRPGGRLGAHRAGQYLALTVEIDGVRRTRTFSISSGERREKGMIALTVKARPGGVVTPRLVSRELRGAVVTVSQPMGEFVLPDRTPRRLLLVSGGSGITPVMSMLRTLIDRGHVGEVVFLHWARSEQDIIFRATLERMAREAPESLRIRVHTALFEPQQLAAEVPDFEGWDTWACGPQPFLDAVTGAFEARGARDKVRVEKFTLGTGKASSDDVAANEVSFVRSQKRAKGGGPILQMAEGAGLNPVSGCRIGICHTCKCRKVSGTTRDVRTGELSTDENVDVQLCVSEPVGPVEIDL